MQQNPRLSCSKCLKALSACVKGLLENQRTDTHRQLSDWAGQTSDPNVVKNHKIRSDAWAYSLRGHPSELELWLCYADVKAACTPIGDLESVPEVGEAQNKDSKLSTPSEKGDTSCPHPIPRKILLELVCGALCSNSCSLQQWSRNLFLHTSRLNISQAIKVLSAEDHKVNDLVSGLS